MEINYWIGGLVLLAALIIVYLLIRRNRKDEKKITREFAEMDIEPQKHDQSDADTKI